MHPTVYTASKWAGAITTILLLGGWVSRSSVRLHKVEEEAAKVDGIQRQIKIMNLYLRLQDPDLYKKAEELAK